ncbi:MAG: hypothetical protein K8U57_28635 [Planctomycetes bacterium]|nr:hypothetical protein [Planctomycetota bacterium]
MADPPAVILPDHGLLLWHHVLDLDPGDDRLARRTSSAPSAPITELGRSAGEALAKNGGGRIAGPTAACVSHLDTRR